MRGSRIAWIAELFHFPQRSFLMPSCDPKRKMISIRLSEAEYEVLRTHYRTYGAHNVSELARLALQRILTGPAATQGDVAVKLSELDERVRSLESSVSLLREQERVIA
jgi:hypothetical protein